MCILFFLVIKPVFGVSLAVYIVACRLRDFFLRFFVFSRNKICIPNFPAEGISGINFDCTVAADAIVEWRNWFSFGKQSSHHELSILQAPP